jgi:hypothetical protein
MQFVLQIALDVGNFRYTRVAQVCLSSGRWQNQYFSGTIVALILVVDHMFFRPICSEKYTLTFGYLRIFLGFNSIVAFKIIY